MIVLSLLIAIRIAFYRYFSYRCCMDFKLEACLHNKNLPFWYIGCQVIESLQSDCLGVVSKLYDLRNIRGPRITLRLGHQIEHSLKRRDCQGLRFCLQRMLTHFLPITNIKNKTTQLSQDAKRDSDTGTGEILSKIEKSDFTGSRAAGNCNYVCA